jgi:hypothetical protein
MKNTERLPETNISTLIPTKLNDDLDDYLKKTDKKKKVVIRDSLKRYLESCDENNSK